MKKVGAMTYICLINGEYKVYEISENKLCNSPIELSEMFQKVFDVDCLIAMPIVLLNQKGYATEMSCSGHYHDRLVFDGFAADDIPAECICQKESDDIYECCYEVEGCPQRSFIRFSNEQRFKTLPAGWKMSDNVYLYYEYPTSLSEFNFYTMQVIAIKALNDWITTLPQK